MKILLVDDSRATRNIQKNLLAQIGNTDVIDAADGAEALKLLETQTPDLALVDWNMPGIDGPALIRRIRQVNAALPLIMCITEAQKKRVIEATRAGANGYLVKPFSAAALKETISQVMSTADAGVRA